jgi:hypothetical protein
MTSNSVRLSSHRSLKGDKKNLRSSMSEGFFLFSVI